MSNTTTLSVTEILSRLAAEVEVPAHSGVPQAQGDLAFPPADGLVDPATDPIPTGGVPLVRGQGGHTHLLLGRGFWRPNREGAQTVGTITVTEGAVYVIHGDGTPASALSRDADHDRVALGPGTYVVRRQREQADEIRQVAD